MTEKGPKEPTLMEQITILLEDELMEEAEVVEQGYNASTVRVVANNLRKEKRIPAKGKGARVGEAAEPTRMQTRGKATAAESIIDAIALPEDGDLPGFVAGTRFGMNLMIVGVRMAQEIASIGVQQAKPLIAMSKEMRTGEREAASLASQEAAMKVGALIMGDLGPQMAAMEGKVEGMSKPTSTNPMLDMMVRAMEPLIKNVMGSMPGMPGGQQEDAQAPSDWTVREEEEKGAPAMVMPIGVDPKKLAEIQKVTKDIRAEVTIDAQNGSFTVQLSSDAPGAQGAIPNLTSQLVTSLSQQLSVFFGIKGDILKKK